MYKLKLLKHIVLFNKINNSNKQIGVMGIYREWSGKFAKCKIFEVIGVYEAPFKYICIYLYILSLIHIKFHKIDKSYCLFICEIKFQIWINFSKGSFKITLVYNRIWRNSWQLQVVTVWLLPTSRISAF